MVPRSGKSKVAVLLILLSFLSVSCQEVIKPRHTVIEGSDLIRVGKEAEKAYRQNTITRLKEKYQRHFAEELYFADLEEAKKKLSEEYTLSLQAQIDKVFSEPYILRMEADFVHSEVQAYAKGEKTLSEILQSPGENIMSLKGQFFGFRRHPKQDPYTSEEVPEYKFLEKLAQDYVAEGVDFVEIWFNEYPQELFARHPLEEIDKQENIFLYLKDESKKVMTGYLSKTYYDLFYNKNWGEPPISRYRSGMTTKPYPGRTKKKEEIAKEDWTVEYEIRDNLHYLQKKYNMEFFHIADTWYAPVQYPQMYFYSLHQHWSPGCGSEGGFDYFLGLYHQYLLNQKIEAVLKEEGLEEDVLYFVQSEPNYMEAEDDSLDVDTLTDRYPFGEEGYTQERLLAGGYSGQVYLNLILLEEEEQIVSKEKLRNVMAKLEQIVDKAGEEERRRKNPFWGDCFIQMQRYKIDPHGKQVVRKLFREHPLTERFDNEVLNITTIASDRYRVRTGTEGFFYLDIFARKIGRD